MIPPLGILQGRLTPSPDGSIQFFPADNWQNEFAMARHIGFDCLELLIKQDSLESNPLCVYQEISQIRRLCNVNNLPVYSIHGFYDKSLEYPAGLGLIIAGADCLNVKTILISFFKENALRSEKDKILARKQLVPVLKLCEILNIHLGIETEMVALELLDFIESFNHPNISVYYDIGNMASLGVDVVQEIKLLGNLICGVHVKDRLANGGQTVPLGEGCADFKAAFAALHDVGYNGPFIIQGARVAGIDDIELNTRYFHFCKDSLQKTYGGGGR